MGDEVKDRSYSDWFGEGNTNEDVKEAIKEHGEPLKIFYEQKGFMAALVYENKVVCTGYDSEGHTNCFLMDSQEK